MEYKTNLTFFIFIGIYFPIIKHKSIYMIIPCQVKKGRDILEKGMEENFSAISIIHLKINPDKKNKYLPIIGNIK